MALDASRLSQMRHLRCQLYAIPTEVFRKITTIWRRRIMTAIMHTASVASFLPSILEMELVSSGFQASIWNGPWARTQQRFTNHKDTIPTIIRDITRLIKMLATLRRLKNWRPVLLLVSLLVVCSYYSLHLLSVFSWSGRLIGTNRQSVLLHTDTAASPSHQMARCRSHLWDHLKGQIDSPIECDYIIRAQKFLL